MVAVLGATGAVGNVVLNVLAERNFPCRELIPLASRRSAGKSISFGGRDHIVREGTPESFGGIDLVFSAVDSSVSRELVPHAVNAGAIVIDKTSAWRYEDDVPLVIPEVNPGDIDGHNGINNPVGMHAAGLEVKSHLVTAGDSFVRNLDSAVVTAGLKVKQMVLEPLASSEALLTSKEKERGAAIVDIGGGTTDIVAFKGGSILYTSVVPVGGFQFTNDISMTFNTSFEEAEQLKLKYASTEPASIDMREQIDVSVLGRSAKVNVYRRDICQLVRERGMELIRLIDLKLQESGIGQNHKAQVVMTGGASSLPGLFEMAQQYMPNCNIRIGFPDHLAGMSEELEAPAYSTGVGMLLWALRNERVAEGLIEKTGTGTRGSAFGGLVNKIGNLIGTK